MENVPNKKINESEFINNLSAEIAKDVNNNDVDQIDQIYSQFTAVLNDSLKHFNSSSFDTDGFLQRLENMDLGDKENKEVLKNILNSIKVDYADVQALNRSEILIKRDLENVCFQMPELKTAISIMGDSIIESNIATGEVSRTYLFENNEDVINDSKVIEIERTYKLFNAIKNYIVPRTLVTGESYVLVTPYSKLFAELKARKEKEYTLWNKNRGVVHESHSLYSEENLKLLMESVSPPVKLDNDDSIKLENPDKKLESETVDQISKEHMKMILENITVSNDTSLLLEEFGPDGLTEFLKAEINSRQISPSDRVLAEAQLLDGLIDNQAVPTTDEELDKFQDIKGCYIKYLNGLQIVPIRLDRKIIGYYYITTSMDLAINPAQPMGIVDLSYQHYTKDKNLLENLSKLIIQAFDKKMLENNIKLKNEIAEIVMSHKFANGRLSFVFIPENEVVRFAINEDEEGKGHSVIEPSLFPARLYTMLLLFSMIYVLNNLPTRIHYVKSSGLNKDYAAQIQKIMRRIQSRRITIDDIYSFSGVLNKVGGMGEMILPTGRGDFKALETDTIPGAEQPIQLDLLDRLRKEAILGTCVPYSMITDAIEGVDFAISVRMNNARFNSKVNSLKIDFNEGITKLYQKIFKYSTDLEDNLISSFKFTFHTAAHQELAVSNEMLGNVNGLIEFISSFAFKDSELKDENGVPTKKMLLLKRKLSEKYLPQLDFESLDKIIDKVNEEANQSDLENQVQKTEINEQDFEELQ